MRRVLQISACILAASIVVAQVEGERTFVKIVHSAEGTVAVDSSGQKWYNDSETGEFSTSKKRPARSDRGSEQAATSDYGDDGIVLPPEVRCTDVYVGDITELFEDVVVDLDERIEGSVTSGKDVIVMGLVVGNVVSFQTVTVESTGEVRGDVFGKQIIRERGGKIVGQRNELPLPNMIGMDIPTVPSILPGFMNLVFLGFLIFICAIVIALVPKPLERIVAKIRKEIIKSFFWGVLGWFSLLPVLALLIITIVGIPVAFLVFPVALVAGIVLAYVSVAIYLGERLCPLVGWQDKSRYIIGICGVVLLELMRLIGSFFEVVGLGFLSGLFTISYIVVCSIALTIGFGAVVSTRFGIGTKRAKPPSGTIPTEPAPAPRPPAPVITPPPPGRPATSPDTAIAQVWNSNRFGG
jgi:hypothetical protein